MAPAKRSKKKSPRNPARAPEKILGAEESRGAEALTVLWMLTALATLIAETVTVLAATFTLRPGGAGDDASLVHLVPGVMLFIALVTGTVCVALTPLVVRLRAVPPPRSVVAIALVLGASPWLLLAGGLVRG